MLIAAATWKSGSFGIWKKLITNDRRLSPKMITYVTSQTITMFLFSWWENTKLQSGIFREHVIFGAGFEEKVPVIVTWAV
jgi:hypothetical protein